jgi:rhodanese-related sulfurtransferase
MELFFQFVSHQWYLFGILSMLLAGLLYHETRKAGPQVSPQQLSRLVNQENAVVVDVRPAKDYRTGHIVDALNLPYDQVAKQIGQMDQYQGRPVVVVCKMGQHSSGVAKQLKAKGFDSVYRLQGGIMEWTSSQMPLVKGGG